jgi:phosphoribosylglycinamide formyltransferase 1
MKKTGTVNLVILASGSGTNAENIIRYFSGHPNTRVSLVISNKEDATVLERAKQLEVPSAVIPFKMWKEESQVLEILEGYKIDFLVLAGYLLLIPSWLVKKYSGKIINIHPSLLPKYGGKGMYGDHVHTAVIGAGDKYSGITIHHVNEHYDKGDVIFQTRCPVLPTDTPQTLAERIHALEYEHYPRVIEKVIREQITRAAQ